MTENKTADILLDPARRPVRAGYANAVAGSALHAMSIILRRKRFALAAVISFMPVLIPLAMAFLSKDAFAAAGNEIFVRMAEKMHMEVLSPLLALFFATMLVAEDAEMLTITYVLTRPLPRSAWVLGRFLAYMTASSFILLSSLALTFAAASTLSKLNLASLSDLTLLAHYCGVGFAALLAYGALAVFLGAYTRRPIVYGVLLLYGWQKIAVLIPGVIDFLTVQKYVTAIYPVLATQRNLVEVQTALGTFQKEVFMVGATKAVVVLALMTALFLGASIVAVRRREYGSGRAIGS